jgi:hypothetical protein
MTPEETEPSEPWLKAGGLLVGCGGAVLLAIVGAFLTPFRIGGVLVPVSLPLVVAGLVGLLWFTRTTTDHVGLSLLPGVVWLLLSLVMSSTTAEGDVVLAQNNWVAIVYLLLGAVTIGVMAYRMVLPRR